MRRPPIARYGIPRPGWTRSGTSYQDSHVVPCAETLDSQSVEADAEPTDCQEININECDICQAASHGPTKEVFPMNAV